MKFKGGVTATVTLHKFPHPTRFYRIYDRKLKCECLSFLMKSPDKTEAVRSSCCLLPPTPTTSWFKKKATNTCVYLKRKEKSLSATSFFFFTSTSLHLSQAASLLGAIFSGKLFHILYFFCNYFERNEWADLKNKLFPHFFLHTLYSATVLNH